jgi:hypothetical protein
VTDMCHAIRVVVMHGQTNSKFFDLFTDFSNERSVH